MLNCTRRLFMQLTVKSKGSNLQFRWRVCSYKWQKSCPIGTVHNKRVVENVPWTERTCRIRSCTKKVGCHRVWAGSNLTQLQILCGLVEKWQSLASIPPFETLSRTKYDRWGRHINWRVLRLWRHQLSDMSLKWMSNRDGEKKEKSIVANVLSADTALYSKTEFGPVCCRSFAVALSLANYIPH